MKFLSRLAWLFGFEREKTVPAAAPEQAKIRYENLTAQARGKKTKAAHPFFLPSFAPGVKPPDAELAMDDANTGAVSSSMAWAGGLSSFGGGIAFLGYPFLSELATLPEYRSIVEILATEMTRKWIKVQSAGEADKTKKIAQLEEELKRLNVRDVFCTTAKHDGFFGRAHLYVDTGLGDDATEMGTPLGGEATKYKFEKGSLRAIRTVEPVWCYPTGYNAIDPLKDNWYRPDIWYVMSKRVHRTRLLTFVGREVSDLLKPAYCFGGLSMSQMVKPYIDNWLSTRNSINRLLNGFSVFVLGTNIQQQVSSQDSEQRLIQRAEFFNATRDNMGLMLIDKDKETFQNVAAQLSGLSSLQSQAQEHMASISRVPLIKLLGIQPAGLNASSEGEITTFEDSVLAYQESFFRPNLTVVFDLAQRNIWGEPDPDITFMFEPLGNMDETQLATLRKIEAETGVILVGNRIVSREEERQRVAADKDTPYASLDVSKVPALDGIEAVTAAGGIATAVAAVFSESMVPLGTAMRILKDGSPLFAGIEDSDISEAEANPPSPLGISPEAEAAKAKLEAAGAKEQEADKGGDEREAA